VSFGHIFTAHAHKPLFGSFWGPIYKES